MNFKLIREISNLTIDEELDKLQEEVAELEEAIQDGDKDHIIEEILDVCQSALSVSQVLKIDDKLYEGVLKHNKKLKSRGLCLYDIK